MYVSTSEKSLAKQTQKWFIFKNNTIKKRPADVVGRSDWQDMAHLYPSSAKILDKYSVISWPPCGKHEEPFSRMTPVDKRRQLVYC